VREQHDGHTVGTARSMTRRAGLVRVKASEPVFCPGPTPKPDFRRW
jgi:hypothetical protein